MRTSTTIWESASRPLFVRTVWLEGSNLRPGLQRHFILDYETKRPADLNKNSVNCWQPKRKAPILEPSFSYDLDFDDDIPEDDLILIDSAKAKLHEPLKPGTTNKCPTKNQNQNTKTYRPSWHWRKFKSYESFTRHFGPRRPSQASNFLSRRSSLQELNSSTSSSSASEKVIAPDEKLAERVLNWLDLAGNEDFAKYFADLKDMEVKLTKTAKLRGDSIKRCLSKSANCNNFNIPKVKTPKVKSASAFHTDAGQNPPKSPGEAVKHITIIFDKEGHPVRFNRPAKNIDLCALSTSPSTTRRLAGTLASARLYKSAEATRLNTDRTRTARLRDQRKPSYSARRRLDTVADLTASNLQKRLQEPPPMASYRGLHDSRKQLHIFMPTLPKKGIANNSLGCGNEDGVSELSQNLSEYCKV